MVDQTRLEIHLANRDGDNEVELSVLADAGGFCGVSTAWTTRELLREFALRLQRECPLTDIVHLPITGDQDTVDVRFTPTGLAGLTITCNIRERIPDIVISGPSLPGASATVVIHVSYEQIRRLGHVVDSLVAGQLDAVCLE